MVTEPPTVPVADAVRVARPAELALSSDTLTDSEAEKPPPVRVTVEPTGAALGAVAMHAPLPAGQSEKLPLPSTAAAWATAPLPIVRLLVDQVPADPWVPSTAVNP